VLLANGYNGMTWGDWRLDLLANQATRSVAISFCDGLACPRNAILPGEPGYTAPANPPWWGTQSHAVQWVTRCSGQNRNMYTMQPGDRFPCVAIVMLPTVDDVFHELHMGYLNAMDPKPETQEVQVTCHSAGADGNCSGWYLDPIPVVNPDGSTSPGQTRARLTRFVTHRSGKIVSRTNLGAYYFTFHVNISRP
jgi:hypothetical protein